MRKETGDSEAPKAMGKKYPERKKGRQYMKIC